MPTVEVIIKNVHSGMYIHPKHQHPAIPNEDPLVLWTGYHSNTHWVFDQMDGKWGYIRHTKSNKVWHPLGGAATAKTNGTKIVLHSDRKPWALFTIDTENNHIVHKDGLIVHHGHGRERNPPNGDGIVLHRDKHEGTKWEFVVSNYR